MSTRSTRRNVSWANDVKDTEDESLRNAYESEEEDDLFGDAAKKREDEEEAARRARIMARSIVAPAKSQWEAGTGNNMIIPKKRKLEDNEVGRTFGYDQNVDRKGNRTEGTRKREARRFDMFAEGEVEQLGVVGGAGAKASARAVDAAVDDEGYAKLMPGEKVGDGRYIIGAPLGRGVFSSVYHGTDIKTKSSVALKVIRSNAALLKAATNEISILKRLDKHPHCINLLTHFSHRSQTVIVTDALDINLRTVLKRFGADRGISLSAVRLYASQLLSALALLKRLHIIHADLKPDNVVVSEDRKLVKLCDFGTAIDLNEPQENLDDMHKRYLVSRFYRPPEVVIGLEKTPAVDMWSLGCLLFELYTGEVAFPARSNGELVELFERIRGPIGSKLWKKSKWREFYLDANSLMFTNAPSGFRAEKREIKSIRERIAQKVDVKEKRIVDDFIDLIEEMLVINAARRIDAEHARRHRFFHQT